VWLTPLLQTAGVPVLQTSYVLSGLDIGSMLGLGLAGYVIGKFGPVRSLLPAVLVLAATIVLIAFQAASFAILLPSGFVIGFAGGIGQSAPLALFAQIYPTSIRSTALGLGGTAGQIGKIASPMLVGTLLASGWQAHSILLAVALLPAGGVLLTLGLALRPPPIVASELHGA
jgi:AAHS family 4-hydroxybenzoate transporter-like MFS transporter